MDKRIISLQNPALHLGKSLFRARLDAEDYVDMGLPSGTKWAASNLDINTSSKLADSPFQYECSFFSWGNVEGHNPVTETSFDYNFGGINEEEPWYEGQPYGATPGGTLTVDIPVNKDFDAARALLGEPWRIPLNTNFQELINNCIYIDVDGTEITPSDTNKQVTVNGIVGLYLQSKINGNRLFFSASGYGDRSLWRNRGISGGYWSASFGNAYSSRRFRFSNEVVNPNGASDRYCGFPIRPVMN